MTSIPSFRRAAASASLEVAFRKKPSLTIAWAASSESWPCVRTARSTAARRFPSADGKSRRR